jgi:hypothetical protein
MNSKPEYPQNGKSESNDDSIGKLNHYLNKFFFSKSR